MGIFEGIGISCCALIIYWLPPFLLTFIAGVDDCDDMAFWAAFFGCIFFVAVILLWASGEPFPIK
jgi:hypothetical protein